MWQTFRRVWTERESSLQQGLCSLCERDRQTGERACIARKRKLCCTNLLQLSCATNFPVKKCFSARHIDGTNSSGRLLEASSSFDDRWESNLRSVQKLACWCTRTARRYIHSLDRGFPAAWVTWNLVAATDYNNLVTAFGKENRENPTAGHASQSLSLAGCCQRTDNSATASHRLSSLRLRKDKPLSWVRRGYL